VERTIVGDTTIVRTLAGSVRGDSVSVVEELRIGVLEGPEEYQFAGLLDLAVDATGGTYVFDSQIPALRYDAQGTYVRTLGRGGRGPGEYGNTSLGLAVRRTDGRLVMRDPRNSRINVYEPDGTPSDSWRVQSGLYTSNATFLDASDHLQLRILTGSPRPDGFWPFALLHIDDQGRIVDTLTVPTWPGDPGLSNQAFPVVNVWAASLSGGLVIGLNDRYSFERRDPDGSVLRIGRAVGPVSVLPEEKREREDLDAWLIRTNTDPTDEAIPPVPGRKPAYRSIVVGEEGRFWVRRYVTAEKGDPVVRRTPPGTEPAPPLTWHEPIVHDVFAPDGSFLGAVVFPPKTTPIVFRGDLVWAVLRGPLDDPYVVRLRIAHG
jgi:hypothetical protein